MNVQVNMIVQIEDYERKSEKTVDRMMCGAIIKTNIWIIVHMLAEWKANGESPGKELVMKKTYKIEVDCANCANKMEKRNEIITIVDKTEYQKLMAYINHEDPKAFVTVYNVSDMRYQPKL